MYKYVKGIKAEYMNPGYEREQNTLKEPKIIDRQSICLMLDYQLKDKERIEGGKNPFIL